MAENTLKVRTGDEGPMTVFSADDLSKIPDEMLDYYRMWIMRMQDVDHRDSALAALQNRDRDLVEQMIKEWL